MNLPCTVRTVCAGDDSEKISAGENREIMIEEKIGVIFQNAIKNPSVVLTLVVDLVRLLNYIWHDLDFGIWISTTPQYNYI